MKLISPGSVRGEVEAPSSKSMMQRAVAAASQASGTTTIFSPSYSDDGKAALDVARALGSNVYESPDQISIRGGGRPTGQPLLCGEAGFSIRMFSAISALYDTQLTLMAKGSLTKRPLGMVIDPLRTLGAKAETTSGFAPLVIKGPMRGGSVTVDGAESSQFVSGLLMALPQCRESSTVSVPVLKSKPYVQMTLELLKDFGIKIEHDEKLSTFTIPGGQRYTARDYTVEGDWSGASFLLVAAAIAGEATISNLREGSMQADRAILEALRKAGAKVVVTAGTVYVAAPASDAPLAAFEFDATECPDLFPPLVVLASQCAGTSTLRGAGRLANKESDRAAALKKEFSTLGIKVEVAGDVMTVTGGTITGGTVSSHHDHRIAMACAVAALKAQRPVEIENADAVAKSFPTFYEVLERLRVK